MKKLILAAIALLLSACGVQVSPGTVSSPVGRVPSTPIVSTLTLVQKTRPTITLIPTVNLPSPPATPLPILPPLTDNVIQDKTETVLRTPQLPERAIRLYFIDPLHGWLLGERMGKTLVSKEIGNTSFSEPTREIAIASSVDGGKTWQPLPLPDIDLSYEYSEPSGIYFVDQNHGWFFYKGLYSTEDGGNTWRDEHIEGTIYRIEQAPDGAHYAIAQEPTGWTVLEVSTAPSHLWPKWKPKFPGYSLPSKMVLANAHTAWVLTYQDGLSQGEWMRLFKTEDSGKSWQEASFPCKYIGMKYQYLSVVADQQLWLACGIAGAGPWGGKEVYFSADGGETWDLRGASTLPPEPDNTLSSLGYLTGMQAFSPSTVYLTLGRSLFLEITRDGGKVWGGTIIPVSTEFTKIFFLDPRVGWAFDQNLISRTSDGGSHWNCTELPESKDCSTK